VEKEDGLASPCGILLIPLPYHLPVRGNEQATEHHQVARVARWLSAGKENVNVGTDTIELGPREIESCDWPAGSGHEQKCHFIIC
jgi:hypothetical protein